MSRDEKTLSWEFEVIYIIDCCVLHTLQLLVKILINHFQACKSKVSMGLPWIWWRLSKWIDGFLTTNHWSSSSIDWVSKHHIILSTSQLKLNHLRSHYRSLQPHPHPPLHCDSPRIKTRLVSIHHQSDRFLFTKNSTHVTFNLYYSMASSFSWNPHHRSFGRKCDQTYRTWLWSRFINSNWWSRDLLSWICIRDHGSRTKIDTLWLGEGRIKIGTHRESNFTSASGSNHNIKTSMLALETTC